MKKTTLLLAFFAMAVAWCIPRSTHAEEQTTIAEWAFDTNSTVPEDQIIQAATGTGTLSLFE